MIDAPVEIVQYAGKMVRIIQSLLKHSDGHYFEVGFFLKVTYLWLSRVSDIIFPNLDRHMIVSSSDSELVDEIWYLNLT
jgi:hypothetical protein